MSDFPSFPQCRPMTYADPAQFWADCNNDVSRASAGAAEQLKGEVARLSGEVSDLRDAVYGTQQEAAGPANSPDHIGPGEAAVIPLATAAGWFMADAISGRYKVATEIGKVAVKMGAVGVATGTVDALAQIGNEEISLKRMARVSGDSMVFAAALSAGIKGGEKIISHFKVANKVAGVGIQMSAIAAAVGGADAVEQKVVKGEVNVTRAVVRGGFMAAMFGIAAGVSRAFAPLPEPVKLTPQQIEQSLARQLKDVAGSRATVMLRKAGDFFQGIADRVGLGKFFKPQVAKAPDPLANIAPDERVDGLVDDMLKALSRPSN